MSFPPLREKERIIQVAKALANPARLRILEALSKGPLSGADIHRTMASSIYYDSTYRHLELLVDSGLALKHYDQKKKRLMYSLAANQLTIIFTRSPNQLE